MIYLTSRRVGSGILGYFYEGPGGTSGCEVGV